MSDALLRVLDRFCAAANDHDVERLVDCFAVDYHGEQPVDPDRSFRGRDTVRERWTEIFAAVPDFRAARLGMAVAGDAVWTEWQWTGTRVEGGAVDVRGVSVTGIRDGRIAWGRFYLEQVGVGAGGLHAQLEREAAEPGGGPSRA